MWTDASPRYLLSWYSPRARFSNLERRWADELAGEAMNGFFELLLDALSLLMAFAPFWRRSVRGFRGRYQFVSSDGDIHTAVTFERSLLFGTRMRVESGSIENPDVKLEF